MYIFFFYSKVFLITSYQNVFSFSFEFTSQLTLYIMHSADQIQDLYLKLIKKGFNSSKNPPISSVSREFLWIKQWSWEWVCGTSPNGEGSTWEKSPDFSPALVIMGLSRYRRDGAEGSSAKRLMKQSILSEGLIWSGINDGIPDNIHCDNILTTGREKFLLLLRFLYLKYIQTCSPEV